MITIVFATGTVAHAAHDKNSLCGAGVYRAAGGCATRVNDGFRIEGEGTVTCKSCLKLLGEGRKPVFTAPSTDPKPGERAEWACPSCDHVRNVWPSDREVRLHSKVCGR